MKLNIFISDALPSRCSGLPVGVRPTLIVEEVSEEAMDVAVAVQEVVVQVRIQLKRHQDGLHESIDMLHICFERGQYNILINILQVACTSALSCTISALYEDTTMLL